VRGEGTEDKFNRNGVSDEKPHHRQCGENLTTPRDRNNEEGWGDRGTIVFSNKIITMDTGTELKGGGLGLPPGLFLLRTLSRLPKKSME